ncbi:MAG: tfuA protein [Deltaproteobacteria bacterium]|nr:tfuA protein [Deltaproteobacteria bacterium]
MKTVVFVGPTLRDVSLVGAEVRPPAGVGDVLRASREGIARIAIIDGYFERMAAVWHKEILVALERGIEVWGAASMGALRAAELDVYGMRGIGAIYRAFKRGDLTNDDEVAVAHLPGEVGYRPVSDALVNLRDGLARAARAGIVTARTRDQLVELARLPFYRERSWARLINDGRAAGLPVHQLAALEAWPKPDRKADDARLLLRTLARTPLRTPRAPKVPRTWALRQLERLSRRS